MNIAEKITELRERVGENRYEFSEHPGRRTPPQYIPRLIEYQLKYEELVKKGKKG